MSTQQESNELKLSYWDTFKVWLYANLILTVLFFFTDIGYSFFDTNEKFDLPLFFAFILYGILVTLPSLFLLMVGSFLYQKLTITITSTAYCRLFIFAINLIYFLVTIYYYWHIIYLGAYAITTLSGIASLYLVVRAKKKKLISSIQL